MHSWLERLKQQSPIGAWSMRGGLPVAGAAHRIEEGACRHSPQDRRDPAMHLDRWDRVLVDQGDGHGLITVHRSSSAFAETLPGRDGGLTPLRADCCPLSLPGKGRFTRRSASALAPMMGRPKADPGAAR